MAPAAAASAFPTRDRRMRNSARARAATGAKAAPVSAATGPISTAASELRRRRASSAAGVAGPRLKANLPPMRARALPPRRAGRGEAEPADAVVAAAEGRRRGRRKWDLRAGGADGELLALGEGSERRGAHTECDSERSWLKRLLDSDFNGDPLFFPRRGVIPRLLDLLLEAWFPSTSCTREL